jgi:hypothetical protein
MNHTSHLISQYQTKTWLAKRLIIAQKERWIIKRFFAAFTHKTLPTPFASQSLNSAHSVPN